MKGPVDAADANPTGLVARAIRAAKAALGAPLDPALRDDFADDVADANRRRLRVLLPLMVVLHAVHVALFWSPEAARATLAPAVQRWRELLVLVHAATLVLATGFAIAMLWWRRERASRWLPTAVALLYVLHAAAIAGVDQIMLTSVTPFVGYCLGIAIVVVSSPGAAAAIFGAGLVAFVVALSVMQPAAGARLASMPNGFTSVLVAGALSTLLYAARRKDFAQRTTIERQRAELAEWNVALEQRVARQVGEIVLHASEVERLNAQLTAQVRARSVELSRALAKLTAQRRTDGMLAEGAVLGDRFEIGALLGAGGMGAVYAGVDRSSGARVAVKVIQAASSSQLDALHRFLREAGTAAAVTHPAVVRMLHVDVSDDGLLFQVQELVVGTALDQRVRKGRPWDPWSAARVGAVLCDALAAAHARGVVHRDVKPANVMLTAAAPGLKLLDFGISKLYDDGFDLTTATRTGVVIGTPAFMSPEQLSGTREVTDRADVFAVGVVLFLLLTGAYPFADGTSPLRMAVDRMLEAAPDVRARVPTLPDALAALVARCLAIEPGERPSAGEVRDALAAFADAEDPRTLVALERAGVLFPGPALVQEATMADTLRVG
jgi:hypothetical protein